MRQAGRLAAETLDFIVPHVRPGISTGELDRLCEAFIRDHGAIPAPLGYKGFPKSICTSVNHVVCHGIPDDKKILIDGDTLKDQTVTVRDRDSAGQQRIAIDKVSTFLAERIGE